MYFVLVEGVRVFEHSDRLHCIFIVQKLRYELHDLVEVKMSNSDPLDSDHNYEDMVKRTGTKIALNIDKFFLDIGEESDIPRGLQWEDNPAFNEYLEQQAESDIIDGVNPLSFSGVEYSRALFLLDRMRYELCYDDYLSLLEEEDNGID